MYHTWTTRDDLLTDCFSVPLIHCTQKVHFLEWVLVCNDACNFEFFSWLVDA